MGDAISQGKCRGGRIAEQPEAWPDPPPPAYGMLAAAE